MKIQEKRIIALLLIVVTIFSNIFFPVVAEEVMNEVTNKTTLYRYREKVKRTTRYPLESPWTLISQTSSMQLYAEYNKLDPKELSQMEDNYSENHYYLKKVSDGSCVKYTTNPHGTGTAYYFDEALPDYGMYGNDFTYSEHPTLGIKIYYSSVCTTYTLSVYTRYEYHYWKWSEWSAWSETPCSASETVEIETTESDILYRYRKKTITTSKTKLSDPWTLYNTTTEYEHSSFGTTVLKDTETIGSSYCVHKKERVDKYVKPGGGSWFYATSSEYIDRLMTNSSLSSYMRYDGYYRYTYCNKKTPYSLYHYYKWSQWSEWSYTPVSQSEDIEVETKIAAIVTIYYDANGGANAPATVTKGLDHAITLSTEVPVKENHQFLGWATSPDGDVEYTPGQEYFENADLTLYAVWSTEDLRIPILNLNYPSLSFEDEIFYNVYFTVDDMSDVVQMGLITFNERLTDGTIDDAVDVIPGYVFGGEKYMVHTNGIPAKNLGDAVYFKVYARLADGSYVYSDVAGYHAVAYANTVLNDANSSAKAKALVVAMLNYGAAAQEYFGYKTDSLMNAALTAEQQALVSAYDSAMVQDVVKADAVKVGSFVMNGGYSKIWPTVSFEGAFSINYYFTPDKTVDAAPIMYYWDAAAYASVDVLTPENATGVLTMTQAGDHWYAAVDGIVAKAIDETVYVAGCYTGEGISYPSGVIAYSLGNYCKSVAANGNELGAATAVYGYYAKAFFSSNT